MYRFNGTPAIGIGVSMAKGGNVLDLGVALEKELTRIESDLPVGIDVHRVANQPEVVEESVGQFTRGLFEAIIIVLIVSFVSLGAARRARGGHQHSAGARDHLRVHGDFRHQPAAHFAGRA